MVEFRKSITRPPTVTKGLITDTRTVIFLVDSSKSANELPKLIAETFWQAQLRNGMISEVRRIIGNRLHSYSPNDCIVT